MKTKNEVYIITEAGQNHNGRMELAKQLIDVSALTIIDKAFNRELPGVNAIKFTKRDLNEELTKEAASKIYDSPHSFGRTYGEHRQKLELSYEEHAELFKYAKSKGLDFIETLTSPRTLKLLEMIELDYIKVASRDLNNIWLLEELAKAKIPMIISTGMGGVIDIDNAVEAITKYHDNIIILHCISQYPAEYANLNLSAIKFLKARYPYKIGYSDHSIGIVAPAVAVSLGADYIEKHITISHSLRGSDQKCALEPEGIWRMVRDIRNMEEALGDEVKRKPDCVESARIKLERSLSTKRNMKQGEVLTLEDLIMLSPGNGLKWTEKEKIIGKRLKKDIAEKTHILEEDVEN
jgi:sialic acid synthase